MLVHFGRFVHDGRRDMRKDFASRLRLLWTRFADVPPGTEEYGWTRRRFPLSQEAGVSANCHHGVMNVNTMELVAESFARTKRFQSASCCQQKSCFAARRFQDAIIRGADGPGRDKLTDSVRREERSARLPKQRRVYRVHASSFVPSRNLIFKTS